MNNEHFDNPANIEDDWDFSKKGEVHFLQDCECEIFNDDTGEVIAEKNTPQPLVISDKGDVIEAHWLAKIHTDVKKGIQSCIYTTCNFRTADGFNLYVHWINCQTKGN